MYRKSAQPRCGYEHWFEKTELSGGCILDMHIHDIDMARFLLGEPTAVSCMAYDADVRWAVENSRLYYKDVMVVADGSWDESAKTPFSCGFSARFEGAQVKFENGEVTVYPDEGDIFKPTLPETDYMAEEIRYLASLILEPERINEKNPPESARQTVSLIEKLRQSADCGGQIIKL
jgi:predicted dehydrogenase